MTNDKVECPYCDGDGVVEVDEAKTFYQKDPEITKLREEVERLKNSPSEQTCICNTPAITDSLTWICQQHGRVTKGNRFEQLRASMAHYGLPPLALSLMEQIEKDISTLKAEIERLKAPLSDRSIEELARDFLVVGEVQRENESLKSALREAAEVTQFGRSSYLDGLRRAAEIAHERLSYPSVDYFDKAILAEVKKVENEK